MLDSLSCQDLVAIENQIGRVGLLIGYDDFCGGLGSDWCTGRDDLLWYDDWYTGRDDLLWHDDWYTGRDDLLGRDDWRTGRDDLLGRGDLG